ncbi:MAG: hypothetical protein PW788_06565 [Micavibrio sp.]|nr:hypothetical protein [Micavibrio sp.]
MMKLKDVIAAPFKLEIMALHYAWNVSMFFLVLPSLNSETSGSPKSAPLKVWEAGRDLYVKGFAKFQVGQIKALSKLGLLGDENFIGKRVDDYLHFSMDRDAGTPKFIDSVMKLNDSGVVSDSWAARIIGKAAHSSDLSCAYDPQTKSFSVFQTVTDAQYETMNHTWDKMIDWAAGKAERVHTLQGDSRDRLAQGIADIFQETPFGEAENDSIFVPHRGRDNGSLAVIFKKAVDGTTGETYAANAFWSGTTSSLATQLRTRRMEEADEIANHLDAYAARAKNAPKL